MGLITNLRISFLSSPEQACEILAKMPARDVVSILASMKGGRLLRILNSFNKEKKEELLNWMTPGTCRKIYNALDNRQLLYFFRSFSLRIRRSLVQALPTKRVLALLKEISPEEEASFLGLFESARITEIFEKMNTENSLEGLLANMVNIDRIDLMSQVNPTAIPRMVKNWKKSEVLELVEKIPQKCLKEVADELSEEVQSFVYRKLSNDKVLYIVSNLKEKEQTLKILNNVGAPAFAKALGKLPRKKITDIISSLPQKNTKEILKSIDLAKTIDLLASWPIGEQVEFIKEMDNERASLIMDGISVSSKLEILKMLPADKSVALLGITEIKKQGEVLKKLPFINMARIFELMPVKTQKAIIDEWEFGEKHKLFNEITPAYASKILRVLHSGGRLRIMEGMTSEHCAQVMSHWEVSEIVCDFRDAGFTRHLSDILNRIEPDLRSEVIKGMDLVLRNRLGV